MLQDEHSALLKFWTSLSYYLLLRSLFCLFWVSALKTCFTVLTTYMYFLFCGVGRLTVRWIFFLLKWDFFTTKKDGSTGPTALKSDGPYFEIMGQWPRPTIRPGLETVHIIWTGPWSLKPATLKNNPKKCLPVTKWGKYFIVEKDVRNLGALWAFSFGWDKKLMKICKKINSILYRFLAHLLVMWGELLVYQWVRRQASVCQQHFKHLFWNHRASIT